MKTLSKKQLAVLGNLSTRAYRHLVAVGYPSNGYDDWRHEFTADHCNGIDTWRSLTQQHYIPLCNALRTILDLPLLQDNTPQTPEDALIWTIRDRSHHWELTPAYIAAIARDKFGTDNLQNLTCKQLLHLIYTLQRAGKHRTDKLSKQLNIPTPPQIHTSRSTLPPPRLKNWRGDIDASPRPQRGRRSASPLQTAP